MKRMKKTLASITTMALLLTMSVNTFAASFSDVTEEYSWAIDAIESMADEGIIKGYGDGTFNPSKTVSNLESLVLLSRILGVEKNENSRLVVNAWELYGDEIAGYNLPYGNKEVAYLVLKGVLSIYELAPYIDESRRDAGIMRHEIAVLLTKAMDAEKNLDPQSLPNLTYSDTETIPSDFRRYVAYVTEIGLMNGVGDNKFAPNDTVTRAQAAVVLYKLREMTKYDFVSGIVADVIPDSNQIKFILSGDKVVTHIISPETLVRYNGSAVSIEKAELGFGAVLTYKDGKFYALDFTDPLLDDSVRGVFKDSEVTTAKGTLINVNVIKDTDVTIPSEKTSYKLGENCVITYNGNTCALSTIKADSYVELTIEESVVTSLEAYDKDSSLNGKVSSLVLEPIYKLRIESDNGVVVECPLGADVKVTRNGKTAGVRDILAGDTVSVTTSYGIIQNVVATSQQSTVTGVIKEVIISKTPRITLTKDGVDTTYFVDANAKIVLSGENSTFYDLRVGLSTKAQLDSDTITSIESVVSDEIITWTGTVTLANTNFGFFQIEFVDPTLGSARQESVFVKETATIVDYKTQKNKKVSDITQGMKISVIGTSHTGIFEANTVIIVG